MLRSIYGGSDLINRQKGLGERAGGKLGGRGGKVERRRQGSMGNEGTECPQ